MLSKLKSLFTGKSKKPDVGALQLDKLVYLGFDYRNHYRAILKREPTPKQIAELFLFRGWTVQYGYSMLCKEKAAADEIIFQCVMMYQTFGQLFINKLNNMNIESELCDDMVSLIDKRWQDYDVVAFQSREEMKKAWQSILAQIDIESDFESVPIAIKMFEHSANGAAYVSGVIRHLCDAHLAITDQNVIANLSEDFLNQLKTITQLAMANGLGNNNPKH